MIAVRGAGCKPGLAAFAASNVYLRSDPGYLGSDPGTGVRPRIARVSVHAPHAPKVGSCQQPATNRQQPVIRCGSSHSILLSLAEPITQTVRRDDVKHFPVRAAVLFGAELGDLLLEPIRLEFCE